jgi:hypothetical protein
MLAGLTDQTTLAQLAGIRYGHDNRGKIEIEKKVDARKRGVNSPDRAEAVVLAYWSAPQEVVGPALARAMKRHAQPVDAAADRLAERRRNMAQRRAQRRARAWS